MTVSSVAKENKIAFDVPVSETARLPAPRIKHPYIFRATSNIDVDGLTLAILMARWKDVKTIATIGPARLAIDAHDNRLADNRPQ